VDFESWKSSSIFHLVPAILTGDEQEHLHIDVADR
jgi:hypothetical protein